MEYEKNLQILACDVKKLKSKICALTKLNEKIREHDFFTSVERSSIQKMLDELRHDLNISEHLLAEKNELYYNRVLKLKLTLDNRQKIINECIPIGEEFDTSDICEVFVETQGTLTEELKKSESILEQQ